MRSVYSILSVFLNKKIRFIFYTILKRKRRGHLAISGAKLRKQTEQRIARSMFPTNENEHRKKVEKPKNNEMNELNS